MQITNDQEKKDAVARIKELKEKISGNDPELASLELGLNSLNQEKKESDETYKKLISEVSDKIKARKTQLASEKKPAETELKELEKAILNYVVEAN